MNDKTPTICVIFGVTGDLSQKKILPSLYRLFAEDMLPPVFRVVGFSRSEFSDEAFRTYVEGVLEAQGIKKGKLRDQFLAICFYTQGFFDKAPEYEKLAAALKVHDDEIGQCTNKLFYLAVPPSLYEPIFRNLAGSGLTAPCDEVNGWTRVLVEKPFGNDLKTAKKLDQLLGRLFKDEQIFRIDHYLAKEVMQNITAFRFSNSLFEPLWNKEFVERVDVRFFEKDGIGTRGQFYNTTGALRDVGQNHMLQMLALIIMDKPASFTGAELQKARAHALESIKPTTRNGVHGTLERGQYEGYRDETNVPPDSSTETYFKVKLFTEGNRFEGVPLFLESGKALSESKAEIVVTFKSKDCLCGGGAACIHHNTLTFRIQPSEGITLSLWTKKPGFGFELEERALSFLYARDEKTELVEAYERVLFDCIRGDQMLFASTAEVLASWRALMPLVDGLQMIPLATYPKGSHGPSEE